MVDFVSAGGSARMQRGAQRSDPSTLYSHNGQRKYLNLAERQRVLAGVDALPLPRALFVAMLAWSGARVSEVLALTPSSFQVEENVVAIRTLKRRRLCIREIPIPPSLMTALDRFFGIAAAQCDSEMSAKRLFPFSRVTAWRLMHDLAHSKGITGIRASPRGLRHAFGVCSLRAGVPLGLVQRWLGHARLASTILYTGATGDDELAFAKLFWRFGENVAAMSETPGTDAKSHS